MSQVDYKQYIEVDPDIRFGKPVIKGTRMTVYDVLQWLASGLPMNKFSAISRNWLKNIYWPVWLTKKKINQAIAALLLAMTCLSHKTKNAPALARAFLFYGTMPL